MIGVLEQAAVVVVSILAVLVLAAVLVAGHFRDDEGP